MELSHFFFQAEDGIRDYKVTGVQTCALPISCPLGVGSRLRSPSTCSAIAVEDSARPSAATRATRQDRKSTRLNSSHLVISYAVFCLKKKTMMHSEPLPARASAATTTATTTIV